MGGDARGPDVECLGKAALLPGSCHQEHTEAALGRAWCRHGAALVGTIEDADEPVSR